MKKVAITGATSGIGLITAKVLQQQGHQLYLLVRNVEKAKKLIASWPNADAIKVLECDLSDLASVKKASDVLVSQTENIDVLINNAGGVFQYREISKDGFELHFAMNHLGHFLLTNLIIHLLKPSARIINVSSEAHRTGKLDFDDLQLEKSYNSIRGYGNAKLCNVYFTTKLHQLYYVKGISSFSLHPGVVRTNFAGDTKGFLGWLVKIGQPLMISPEKGVATTLYLATTPNIENLSGQYFKKQKPTKVSSIASSTKVADRLWEESLKLVSGFMKS